MILWRPTNNNQRYAFTPLLDSGDETEEDDVMVNENLGMHFVLQDEFRQSSYFCCCGLPGMKMRVTRSNNASTPSPRQSRDGNSGSIVSA